MTKAVEAVLADALRLDLDARAELAAELLASLDGPSDPDAEAAWAAEIERRVAAIEAGGGRVEPWGDVKRGGGGGDPGGGGGAFWTVHQTPGGFIACFAGCQKGGAG